MDLPGRQLVGTRRVLLVGVGLNFLAAGLLGLEFFTNSNACNSLGPFSLYCAAPLSAHGWFWSAVTVSAVLPVLGLLRTRFALIGAVSQAGLLFLSLWAIPNWGLFSLSFAGIGAVLGLWTSARIYGRGVVGPPRIAMVLGATWAAMVAVWTALIVYFPYVQPTLYTPAVVIDGPNPTPSTFFLSPIVTAEWAVPVLILTTALALVPISRPRSWPAGLAGSIGVMAVGILLTSYFDTLTIFAIFASFALMVGGAGYHEFAKTGRTIGQWLDAFPPPNQIEQEASPSPDVPLSPR